MQLAEALIDRADLQKRAQQLQERVRFNARTQEGEPPAEDPAALLAELMDVYALLGDLIPRIHRSNTAARLQDGRTLTDALARREVLDLRLSALRSVTGAASMQQTRSELPSVTHLPVRELQAQTDRLARERRELETQVQQANWASAKPRPQAKAGTWGAWAASPPHEARPARLTPAQRTFYPSPPRR